MRIRPTREALKKAESDDPHKTYAEQYRRAQTETLIAAFSAHEAAKKSAKTKKKRKKSKKT